jgi:hypothetical protein
VPVCGYGLPSWQEKPGRAAAVSSERKHTRMLWVLMVSRRLPTLLTDAGTGGGAAEPAVGRELTPVGWPPGPEPRSAHPSLTPAWHRTALQPPPRHPSQGRSSCRGCANSGITSATAPLGSSPRKRKPVFDPARLSLAFRAPARQAVGSAQDEGDLCLSLLEKAGKGQQVDTGVLRLWST